MQQDRRNPPGVLSLASVFASALLCADSSTAEAQSAQLISIQASGLITSLDGQSFTALGFVTGVGGEFQVRLNPGGGFSLGAGLQITRHNGSTAAFDSDLTLTGFFAEPRYAIRIRSRSLRPYLAARLSVLKQSVTRRGGTSTLSASARGAAFGGGAGIVVRLSRSVNLDLGTAVTAARFGSYTVGGTKTAESAGRGSSIVAKIGINVGLGS